MVIKFKDLIFQQLNKTKHCYTFEQDSSSNLPESGINLILIHFSNNSAKRHMRIHEFIFITEYGWTNEQF